MSADVTIPRRRGEMVRFEAHGRTLKVKRTRCRSWVLTVEGEKRKRWASTAAEVHEDIVSFTETGRLPRSPSGWA